MSDTRCTPGFSGQGAIGRAQMFSACREVASLPLVRTRCYLDKLTVDATSQALAIRSLAPAVTRATAGKPSRGNSLELPRSPGGRHKESMTRPAEGAGVTTLLL